MAYLFTLVHPAKTNQDPAEFIGIIHTNDADEAVRKAEAAMPAQLKKEGYKVWICNMGDPLPDFCLIIANNVSITLDRFSENRFVREFLDGRTDRSLKG